ncbi:MAG: DNA topoisomerase I [Puniceicoccaceae bacterium 5H]|nr:MAG: DNA topoisomerase I [Puniceicoccaceae bacterium 5H]
MIRVKVKLRFIPKCFPRGTYRPELPGTAGDIAGGTGARPAESGGVDLVYVSDSDPGFTRKGAGKGFYYLDEQGERIRDRAVIQRINSLAIPPAYRDVWICPLPNGHLQATGRDARKRKQYRYHPEWSQWRNDRKFERLHDVGEVLPRLRQRLQTDLARPELDRRKVIAALLRIMDRTGVRVGNEVYRQENHSHGLTTLDDDHADVDGKHIHLEFLGKSGVETQIDLNDRRVAKVIAQCHDLPGQRLFTFKDAAGELHPVDSEDVNAYLHDLAGDWLSSKFLRTWHASTLAYDYLSGCDSREGSKTARKKTVVQTVKEVAAHLHNRPATCRKYYIHPRLLEAYEAEGCLPEVEVKAHHRHLRAHEARFLAFLDQVGA